MVALCEKNLLEFEIENLVTTQISSRCKTKLRSYSFKLSAIKAQLFANLKLQYIAGRGERILKKVTFIDFPLSIATVFSVKI